MMVMARKKPEQPSIFATNLAKLRADAGLTQEQLGEKIGLTRLAVMNLENGSSEPKSTTLSMIATLFNKSMDALYMAEIATSDQKPVASEQKQQASGEERITLDVFLGVARGFLDEVDLSILETLRTRVDQRGLTRRDWLKTVYDIRAKVELHARDSVGRDGGKDS